MRPEPAPGPDASVEPVPTPPLAQRLTLLLTLGIFAALIWVSSVQTGFSLPNNPPLPFWHVMFQNIDISSERPGS